MRFSLVYTGDFPLCYNSNSPNNIRSDRHQFSHPNTGPYIVVLPLNDISELASFQSDLARITASYVFGDRETCEETAEMIKSDVVYWNQIPSSLLYGPVSLAGYKHQLHPRYTVDMFSTSSPIVIERVRGIPDHVTDLEGDRFMEGGGRI